MIKVEIPVDGRVVGGENAKPHSAPFIVSLRWSSSEFIPGRHFCGGSIITPKHIVTAAHCILTNGLVTAVAGAHDISNPDTNEQSRKVIKQIGHERYPGGAVVAPYDIAVLFVEKPFEFNEFVNSVVFSEQDKIHKGNAQIFGWGSVSNSSRPQLPTILQTKTLEIININRCFLLPNMIGTPLHSTNLCTGPLNSNTDACSGDSGGPLVQRDQLNQWELVGIVSWGYIPCGRGPSVFTRASAHTIWLNSIILQ